MRAARLPRLAGLVPRLLCAAALPFAACGGASGGAGPGDPVPDVALVVVGGHSPAPAYLEATVEPFLREALEAAGHEVASAGFVDAGDGPKGYGDLVLHLRRVRDDWVAGRSAPAKVVLVAHSHGGPWAHGATRDVPDCPVRCLVDLDTSSYGWPLTHAAASAALGGTPEDAQEIPLNVADPRWPDVTSEPGFVYDLEDVVFPSVRDALEVVTGDVVPVLVPPWFQRYDERWNARPDATTTGLDRHYSGTPHTEPVTPPAQGGTTLLLVRDWILDRLAGP